ncbi:MAG: hypothetical protein QM571_06690 [Micrococcaceae bacterium]
MCKKFGEKWCTVCKAQFLDYQPTLFYKSRLPFPLWHYAIYGDGFDVLLKNYKSAGRRDLLPFIASALTQIIEAAICESTVQNIILVPMPVIVNGMCIRQCGFP